MTSTLSPAAAASAERPRKVSLSYLPGLDGLRAISVVAVLLYHGRDLGIDWLPEGGFLGVEVFFVISGYLITALLLAEYRNHATANGRGRIDLKGFWLRRARRLLPALYLLLATVSLFWFLFIRDEMYRLRGEVVAAITYVTNWYLIFSNQSYFDQAGRPSPFRHLWSLAVEEQFYLIWPLLFLGLLLLCKGRKGRLLTIIVALALASTVWMAMLYEEGTDPSRVYYGTDTRAAGLLIGAALAVLLPPWHMRRTVGAHARWVIDGIGVASLLGLLWFFRNSNEFDPFLYQGGFLILSLVTAVAIGVAAHPASLIGSRVLGARVLTWIGVRSYGIYLWHWPLFMITRPDLDLPFSGYPLLIGRFVVTGILAELSYRFVEVPIRKGAIGAWLARYRASKGEARASLARKAMLGGLVCSLSGLVIVAGYASARPNPNPQGFGLDAAPATTVAPRTPGSVLTAAQNTAPSTNQAATTQPAATTPGATAPATTAPAATAAPTAPPATAAPLPYAGVVAIGDSVMLGAKGALEARMPGILVDAAVSRQVKAGAELAATMKAQGLIGRAAVIHLGTNGVTTQAKFDELMTALAGVPRVVLVNTKVPRPWEDRVNGLIAETAKKNPNVVFVDWKAQSSPNKDWFWNDGMHLRPKGAAAFAELIAQAIG